MPRQAATEPSSPAAPRARTARACCSLIATCRTVGVPVQACLTWVFERPGTHRDIFELPLEEMTPAAVKKTLG